jgi:Methyltransferase domain
MPVWRYLRAHFHRLLCKLERDRLLRSTDTERVKSTVADWPGSLTNPTEYYCACFQFFHALLPRELQEHRRYFTAEFRGFGEDAFHVMWAMIFERFRPLHFLEIGVYRGQILSLAGLMQKSFKIDGVIAGISPFQPTGDSVSRYLENVDYLNDTRVNMEHFALKEPALLKALSTDPEAVAFVRARMWDCIYIDGNHDYEVVRADWDLCANAIRVGGLVVLDDASLGTEFKPPAFAAAGHPGPSQVAREIDRARFREVLRVGHNRVFERTL